MSGLVSPDEMMEAARQHMLDGRTGVGYADAGKLMNFLAYNVNPEVREAACLLLRSIYPEELGMLTDDDVKAIVAFQNTQPRHV